MNRPLSGAAVAALLLTTLAVTSPAPATVPLPSKADTLKVHREYGDGPVTIPAGVERLRLTFHGRKGNTVDLKQTATRGDSCGKVSLRGPSGKVGRWLRGAWQLPATGRYSFVLTRCDAKDKASAQLTKVRLRQLRVDGDARVVTYGDGGAYKVWTTVVVPRLGRVQVRSTSSRLSPWCTMYLEGAPVLDLATWHQEYELSPRAIYLEAGVPVSNELGTMVARGGELVPQAGQRAILVPCYKRVRARATTTHLVPGALDGTAVELSAERPFQEVGVRFESQGDQWVVATVNGPLASRSMPSLALTGPDGSTLVSLNNATYGSGGSPDLWYLPEAGSYQLMVRTDPEHQAGTVALATVRELEAEMPTDGQSLAFTAQKPGEWMLATRQLPDQPYTLSAEAGGATGWRAYAKVVPFELCRGAFCADRRSATLSPKFPTSSYPPLQAAGSWIFVVGFAHGQTGTVSLRLEPYTGPVSVSRPGLRSSA